MIKKILPIFFLVIIAIFVGGLILAADNSAAKKTDNSQVLDLAEKGRDPIKKIWDFIGGNIDKVKTLYNKYVGGNFDNLIKKAKDFFEKIFVKREAVIKREFSKEVKEMAEDIPRTANMLLIWIRGVMK